jgi:hypothetical protein
MTLGLIVFCLAVAALAPTFGTDTRTPELLERR